MSSASSHDPNLKSWESYHVKYHDAEISIHQARIVTIVAGEVLKKYPKNLPPKLADNLRSFMRALARSVPSLNNAAGESPAASPPERDTEESRKRSLNLTEKESELNWSTLLIYGSRVVSKRPVEVDFVRLLFMQELILLYAHLDGFMNDTLKAIISARPEVLRNKKKTMTWDEALSSGDWDTLVGQLGERLVFEFGWEPISKRIDLLKSEFGLDIKSPKKEVGFITRFDQVRNVLVHNGGRASQEYLRRTGDKRTKLGDPIPITAKNVSSVSSYISLLCGDIFTAVSVKFFQKDRSDLSGILMRGE